MKPKKVGERHLIAGGDWTFSKLDDPRDVASFIADKASEALAYLGTVTQLDPLALIDSHVRVLIVVGEREPMTVAEGVVQLWRAEAERKL